MVTRFAIALAVSLALAVAVHGSDLPVGKWSIVEGDRKGDLVIKEVGRDGKVTATVLESEATGTWDGTTLTLKYSGVTMEACLVKEAEKEQTKYTLTGFKRWRMANLFVPEVGEYEVKSGWYAQKMVKVENQIKVEVKGTLIHKAGTGTYVSVKRDDGFGRVEETRVYFWLSEGEWKYWRDVMPKLDGQAVTVTGAVGQMPKDTKNSIPEGAVYFLRGFEIKSALGTFK